MMTARPVTLALVALCLAAGPGCGGSGTDDVPGAAGAAGQPGDAAGSDAPETGDGDLPDSNADADASSDTGAGPDGQDAPDAPDSADVSSDAVDAADVSSDAVDAADAEEPADAATDPYGGDAVNSDASQGDADAAAAFDGSDASDGHDGSEAAAEDATSDGAGTPDAADSEPDGDSDGGAQCVPDGPAVIVTPGPGPKMLLRGLVVTPDQVFNGEVVISGDVITCVAASCGAADVVVETHGMIFPGLIDTHNHILFDIFDETDWSPVASYTNHNQWTNEARYGAMVDAKQYLNGEGTSPVDYGCEMNKYGELKGLVAGTTAIVGAANPANRACYGSLARTIDQTPNGLAADKIQVATLFPATSAADGVCSNFASSTTDAYVIHVGEGVDNTALNEFNTLGTVTTTDGCLYAPQTAIVHGTAFGDAQLSVMAQHQMSLVWSPRSNVFLYGAGTDLSKTANVPLALSKGINIALGPDWSLGGSQNLLDELRFADQVDNAMWGNQLTPQMLVKMVTTNAARALGLQAVLGSIEPGKKADLMVIGGDACAPYDALLAAKPASVRLVIVDGVVLYGDSALKSLGPVTPGCEDLDVCGVSKFACVARSGGTVTNKLGQTLAEVLATIDDGLVAYDALNLTQWKFAPRTPVVRCTP
jgi:5-methylthioadenosine/S-adenosylhomocysteine deaminase